mgnify:FL=1
MALDILIVLGVIYLVIGLFHSFKYVLNDDYKDFNNYSKIKKTLGIAIVVIFSFIIIIPLWVLFYIKDLNKKGE